MRKKDIQNKHKTIKKMLNDTYISTIAFNINKFNAPTKRHRLVQSVQFSRSVVLTLCDPMNRRMSGLPVHHQLPEFTQPHVHQVGDTIKPPHPLLSPSPPDLNPSQDQGLFK